MHQMAERNESRTSWTRLACHGLAVALFLSGLGCTTKLGTRAVVERYVPEDSRIQRLGDVSASETVWQWLWAQPVDNELYEQVRAKALSQHGGDLLIDVKVDATLTYYPVIVLYRTTLKIEGSAAKLVPRGEEPSPAEGLEEN